MNRGVSKKREFLSAKIGIDFKQRFVAKVLFTFVSAHLIFFAEHHSMELFFIFCGNIILLSVIYSIGSLLLFPHRNLLENLHPYGILAHKLFFGVIGTITTYSLIATSFLSINLIFVAMYIVSVFYTALKKNSRWRCTFSGYFSDIRILHYFLPVILIAICIGLFRFHYFIPGVYFFAHTDNTAYLQIARFMPLTSLENIVPWNAVITGNSSAFELAPYHYGDLWLASFCLKLCPFLLPMVTYYFVLTPVLIILAGAILTTLIHSLMPSVNFINFKIFGVQYNNHDNRINYLIAFVGFLFAMYWGYTPKIPLGFIHTVSIEHKNFNFIFPIAYGVFCYLLEKKTPAYFALSSVLILDYVYYPVVAAAAALLALYFFFSKDFAQLKLLLITFSFGLFVLLFYSMKGSLLSNYIGKTTTDFGSWKYLTGSLHITASSLLKHMVTSFPFYILFFYFITKRLIIDRKTVHIVFFLSGMIILSLFLVGFSHFQVDHVQFARPVNPCTSIGLLVALAVSYHKEELVSKKTHFILCMIVLMQALLAVFSQSTQRISAKGNTGFPVIAKETLNDLSRFLDGEDKVIAFFPDNKVHSLAIVYFDYNFSGFLKKNICFAEINLPDTINPGMEDWQVINLKLSPFFEYMEELKQKNSFQGLENAQRTFLREQKINFILLSRHHFPAALKNNVIDSLVFDAGKPLKIYKLQ